MKESPKRLLLVSAALGAAGLACSDGSVPIQTITPKPTQRTPEPTWTLPFSVPETNTPRIPTTTVKSDLLINTPQPVNTEIPTPTNTQIPTEETPKPPEFMQPYIGNVYLGNPFQINLPEETARLATLWGGEKTFSIDSPLVVGSPELSDEQISTMSPHNIVNDPRVGLVFQTDNRRVGLTHVVLYAHSGYSLFGERLPLDFFRKIINENENSLIGTKLSLVQDQNVSNLEVVHYERVNEEQFNVAFANYKNDERADWRSTPLFLRFETLGIDIAKPPFNGNDHLISFVACYGPITNITEKRMIITARYIP